MAAREQTDFHAVEPHQREIDKRLVNWAKWCNGSSAPSTSPMFRMCPPPPQVRADRSYASDCIDSGDASRIAKAVTALPEKHRAAINWSYVKPVSPRRKCQELGVNLDGLSKLVRDGRQMLINRKV